MALTPNISHANPNTPLWLPADTPVTPPPTEWLKQGSPVTTLSPGQPIDWFGQATSGSVYPTTPGKSYQITILGSAGDPFGVTSPNDVLRVLVSVQGPQTLPVFPFPPMECWAPDIRLNQGVTQYQFTTVLTCKVAGVLDVGIEFIPFTGTTGQYTNGVRSVLITELP